MKLFELNPKTSEVEIEAQALLLEPFKKIFDRDKSKDKHKAKLELAFIYFYSDIKSDYQYLIDRTAREVEIIRDLKLGKTWSADDIIKDAIRFYEERSKTPKTYMYESACIAVEGINDYLRNTSQLLESGKLDIAKATAAIVKVPELMENLDIAYNKLIKEQKDIDGRSKGAKVFNMFEDGI